METRRGIVFAALAYLWWGLFPLYVKALQAVPPIEILAHRMVWSLMFVGALLAIRRQWAWLPSLAQKPRILLWFMASAATVTVNWGVYIWAVNSGHIVDSSLGYFINPLVNVLIGAFVLRERLRPIQWTAVAIAAGGVVWLTWQAGQLPWIGLVLAFSFATYGLLRKTAALGAIEGLALETALLFPIAFGYLAWLAAGDRNTFIEAGSSMRVLLALAGPVTAVPLLLFAAGARRIPFSLLGLLQYIGPTLQLLIGVWVFDEPFVGAKALGYAAIWIALAVYSAESLWRLRVPAPRRAST